MPLHALRKVGSAGRPALLVDTRIVGQGGTGLAVGEIGELLVRGPNVMAGYWKRPDATRAAIDGQGWLRTGDAVRLDDEGFFFVVGRVEDAYTSAGQVVHPGIAEGTLLQHPAVAEVCIVGDDLGAIAYVVRAPDATGELEAELLSWCRQRLPGHACPAAIEFVASLPRNPGGKIMRYLLRRPRAASSSTLATVATPQGSVREGA